MNFQNNKKLITKSKRIKFPTKLYYLIEKKDHQSIIYWCLDSNAFMIHKHRFEKEVIPKYFQTSRLKSIQKQFNIYGFDQVKDIEGGLVLYEHQHFKQDKPHLLNSMKRVKF